MIKIKNLKKSFGTQVVLDGVDFEIPREKLTVILGRSGEGKSVLLKHVIGLVKPDAGQIWVDGQEITVLSERQLNDVRKKFGMLFQSAALFDSFNVEDNVAFPLREHTQFSEADIKNIVKQKLEQVGLKNVGHKLPNELSGGMRKRVGLARALALNPSIILYDEPTTGLDPVLTDSIDHLILDTQKKFKVTSVVISHDIKSTFKIADKIAMLHDGKMIEEGGPEEFRESKNPIVQKFLSGKADPTFIGWVNNGYEK